MDLTTDDEGKKVVNAEGEQVGIIESVDAGTAYVNLRADTPGCTTEACEFDDALSAFDDADAAVVGISDDPVSDLESFAAEYDLSFDLLSDESGEVASKYGSYGEKQMFGNTFDGVFRDTHVVDPSGQVEAVYEDVSPEGHAETVLENLE